MTAAFVVSFESPRPKPWRLNDAFHADLVCAVLAADHCRAGPAGAIRSRHRARQLLLCLDGDRVDRRPGLGAVIGAQAASDRSSRWWPHDHIEIILTPCRTISVRFLPVGS